MIVPVLLSGGDGTRLWPVSRRSFPKQFANIINRDLSLIQMTVERLKSLSLDCHDLLVVASEEHRFILSEQLSRIGCGSRDLILEPAGRNTAPAITLAAIAALQATDDAKLLIQTSDHLMPDFEVFRGVLEAALSADQPLVTFGVQPTRAETGYGYIKVGNPTGVKQVYCVEKFIEKPSHDKAELYFEKGGYLWNSGMFLFDAKEYLKELEVYCPDVLESCKAAMTRGVRDGEFFRVSSEAFLACPSISVDYAVLEKSKKVNVVPFVGDWTDLGSWDAVASELEVDEMGNTAIGNSCILDSKDTLVTAHERLVVALGVNGLVVVETPDAVMVASKESAQSVGNVVKFLRDNSQSEADEHVVGYRPWGNYLSVLRGDNFQIKRITVKPGKALSLQSHRYRSEHWVVVSGVASVVVGDEQLELSENESTYIGAGVLHRLSNNRDIDLILIEVQTGTYLGEDDIIRYDDEFGRA